MDNAPERYRTALFEAAGRTYAIGNRFGVVGFTTGPRTRRGRRQRQETLIVLVPRKLHSPGRPIEPIRFEVDGVPHEAVPDVLAVGRPCAQDAPLAEFTGLHPGAGIRCPYRGGGNEYGGVACILGTGGEPTHLLTAGHLFDPSAAPDQQVVEAGRPAGGAAVVGHCLVDFLDVQPPGLSHPLDVAIVELNGEGVRIARDSRAERDDPWPSAMMPDVVALDRACVAFEPTIGDYSPATRTRPRLATCDMEGSARRGPFRVHDVLFTQQQVTHCGDSGTCLVTQTARRVLLGSCVGAAGGSLFEPAWRAVEQARTHLGIPDLDIWRGE